MILGNGLKIKNNRKPYIVAELNSSHRGKTEIAKEMIEAAKECGCDAVKFQSWSSESLYCQDYYDKNPMAKRMVGSFSLTPEKLLEISRFCDQKEIDFSSTPYSKQEVDFLIDECNAPFVKIASMDINNYPFLKYVADKGVPVVLSTGMADIDEIRKAVAIFEAAGNKDLCILHCVSEYPVAPSKVNLNNIKMLMREFSEYEIGYSDHTIGCEAACAAVALGCAIIEKHFTLDNTKIGWDNQMATEPEDMKRLVEACQTVYQAMGNEQRIVSDDEREQRYKMRRSLVSTVDMEKGHIICEEDITAKRPGDGISVEHYYSIIGRQLEADISANRMLKVEHIPGV